MEANRLLGQALDLGDEWKVVEGTIDIAEGPLSLKLNFRRDHRCACPKCRGLRPVHDGVEKNWRLEISGGIALQ